METLATFGPLALLMLIPVWIPLIAVVGGWIADRLSTPAPSELSLRLDAAREATRLRREARDVHTATAA